MRARLLTFLLATITITFTHQAAFCQVTGDANSGAKILDLKGEVHVQLPQQTLVLASRQMTLPPGSTIMTSKGSALLQMSDGSEVLVKSNSRLQLKSPDNANSSFFDLLLGKIRASVTKRLRGEPSFKLGTPSAVITVRGTRFEVHVDKRLNTSVEVYEGVVEVADSLMGNRVLLYPGYFTDVPRNMAPEAPRMIHPESFGGRQREEGGMGSTTRNSAAEHEDSRTRSGNSQAGQDAQETHDDN